MRTKIAAALLAVAGIGSLTLGQGPLEARIRISGEERLARLIDGRVAGEPRNCVFMPRAGNLTVIDKTAIVYESGGTVWVNRTQHPRDLDDDDILVIRRFGGANLCRQDTITLADRSTGFFSGVLFLSDFVPYRKAG